MWDHSRCSRCIEHAFHCDVNLPFLQGNDDAHVPIGQMLDAVVLNPVLPLAAVVLQGFIHDPKAWLNKWRVIHLAIERGSASWAPSAADATAALLAPAAATKTSTCVSVLGCVVEVADGKVDGKEHVMRVRLANGTEVRCSFAHAIIAQVRC
jgi:hypothetical protein